VECEFVPPHFAKSSNGMEIQYYWRQHQQCPEFSPRGYQCIGCLVSNSSGMEDGEGLGFWMKLCFGLVTGAIARVVGMSEAAGAEVRHWLILVHVYLLD
jgi:hypothetical protein